ncbi:kinase-like protein [Macrolepiota fuliginosa MF-IS2]|uniref:Kinase-like protein n=1 Tax=Macrolepiota fuliginosa MF-IS2 TaxID=1400762 RepID=A0A9P6BXH9_9AGAR|nr:kinase-like protein [Macrolepiota fuliginosa MF-IS2]
MGPTGAGKSTFIQKAIGRETDGVGHGLGSCTSKVTGMRVTFSDGISVVLVDTPGFDDTHLSDLDVLRTVAKWLGDIRRNGLVLSGILYLHRISDQRMAGTPLKNLDMFKKLCGGDFFEKVILMTTMWPEGDSDVDKEIYTRREQELFKIYWAEMIRKGSLTHRFMNTQASAWEILDCVVADGECRRRWINIQKELVDQGRSLSATGAGRQLHSMFETLTKRQNVIISRMDDQLKETGDPDILKELLNELNELRKERDKAVGDMRELDLSLAERLRYGTFNLMKDGAQAALALIRGLFPRNDPTELRAQVQVLVSQIAMNDKQRTSMTGLRGEEAQCITEVINDILHETNKLQTYNGGRVLFLLCRLARSASVFPRCYEIKGVQRGTIVQDAGTFADVYKGQFKNETVCFKMVRITQNNPPQPLAEHAEELVLWAHLSHLNVLPFYGVYVDPVVRRPCLVSPWMENGNLCNYLKNCPQDLGMLLVSDIINGLCYLHELRIVHGDLKGQNILVSGDKRALIADFGTSRTTSASINASSHKGTLRWSAPELCTGEEYILPTLASDIWSFGCACYEVLARKEPFDQYPRKERVIAVLLKGFEIPRRPPSDDPNHIDDSVWNLMVRCWNYAPKKRPTCKDLQSFFEAMKLSDDRPGAQSRADSSAFWETARAASKEQVDYQRALEILTRI